MATTIRVWFIETCPNISVNWKNKMIPIKEGRHWLREVRRERETELEKTTCVFRNLLE